MGNLGGSSCLYRNRLPHALGTMLGGLRRVSRVNRFSSSSAFFLALDCNSSEVVGIPTALP